MLHASIVLHPRTVDILQKTGYIPQKTRFPAAWCAQPGYAASAAKIVSRETAFGTRLEKYEAEEAQIAEAIILAASEQNLTAMLLSARLPAPLPPRTRS